MPTAIPLADISCPDTEVAVGGCIDLPGGIQLCAQNGQLFASKFEIATQLFAQLNAVLAPLKPIFDIIAFGLALQKVTQAIPDAITSLSPTKITDALVDVVKKAEPLLRLIPQLSVPFMILSIIDALLLYLEGVGTEVQRLVDEQVRIAAAQTAAADPRNAQLNVVVDCANELLSLRLDSLNTKLGPLNQLLGLINVFCDLVGLDPLPTLNDLDTDVASNFAALDTVAQTLRELRDKIPV